MKVDKLKIARQFMEAVPHARALGIEVVELAEARAVLALPYDLRFVGDPQTGVLHGGVVFTLMDSAAGTAVILHPAGPGGTATMDLRVDYMRAATPGQRIVADAVCYHMTRSVAFIRVTACDDDTARPVAVATGAFTVDPGMEGRS